MWVLAFGVLFLFCGESAQAETRVDDLIAMSLKELMQQEVTISNRAKESAFLSSSAITVISAKQIKNSGLRTIPELMRLVPGFHVKRIDGNKWAINSRRVSTRFANSMLVLMDGRTLYSPLWGGTYWNLQNAFIEDIDHIEVIRGPGSASWGANAITGVINIVTKRAEQTQGSLAYAATGQGEIANDAGVRMGIQIGNGTVRTYAKYRETDEGRYLLGEESNNIEFIDEPEADDGTESALFGFRYDLEGRKLSHTLMGEWYEADENDTRYSELIGQVPRNNDADGYHLLYNVEANFDSVSRFELTAYYDHTQQLSDTFRDKRDIADIEGFFVKAIDSHKLSVGASFRHIKDSTSLPSGSGLRLDPASRSDQVWGFFMQDNWEIRRDTLWLTLGSRFESNDYSGGEYNPSVRMLFKASEQSVYWGAITRSVRTPSRINSDACIGSTSTCFVDISSADSDQSEKTVSFELGHRHLISAQVDLDLTVFYDREKDPLGDRTGSVDYENKYRGMETELSYRALNHWQLGLSAVYLDADPDSRFSLDSNDVETWSGKIRSHYQFSKQISWNLFTFFYEGERGYSSVTRLDTILIWQVSSALELQLSLNNLLDDYHYEAGDATLINSAIRRGGMIYATFHF